MPTEHPRDPARDPHADPRILDALHGAHALLLDEVPLLDETPVAVMRAAPASGGSTAWRHGRRAPWLAAAVAAGVLVAGGGVVAALHQASRTPHAMVAVQPSPGMPTPDPAVVPHAGWKWVSVNGVTLEVPSSWGWGEAPGAPDCSGTTSTPHVVMPLSGITALGCAQPSGQYRQPVVQVLSARQGSAATVSRVVGQHRVQITWGSALESPRLRRTAQHILASAHEFRVDVNGCPVTPAAPTGALDEVRGADRGVVCQYGRGLGGGLTAVASRPLDALAAHRLAQALADAPAGGGPNPAAGSCTGEDQLITVMLHTAGGLRTVAVHYTACDAPNGVVAGDGHFHRLTRANCLGALGDPVRINAVPETSAQACMRM